MNKIKSTEANAQAKWYVQHRLPHGGFQTLASFNTGKEAQKYLEKSPICRQSESRILDAKDAAADEAVEGLFRDLKKPAAMRVAREIAAKPAKVAAAVKAVKLTDSTKRRFLAYAKDAGNWSGTPLVGGNLGGDAQDCGYLLHMKMQGLITTLKDRAKENGTGNDLVWMHFTDLGAAYAAAHGVKIDLAHFKKPT